MAGLLIDVKDYASSILGFAVEDMTLFIGLLILVLLLVFGVHQIQKMVLHSGDVNTEDEEEKKVENTRIG